MRILLIIFLTLSNHTYAQTISELHEASEAASPWFFDKSQFRLSAEDDIGDIEEIGIQRTGCFGTCPIYEFRISSDGRVNYSGFGYVDFEGKRIGSISQEHLINLYEFIQEIDFGSFQDVYTVGVTDNPTIFTMVKFKNGTVKIVSNYANSGPVELWALEQLIDNLQYEVEWQK